MKTMIVVVVMIMSVLESCSSLHGCPPVRGEETAHTRKLI